MWYVFADVTVFVQRFPLLFVFSYWIVVPNMVFYVKNNKFLKICILVFALVKAQLQFGRNIYRYDNILFGIENYDSRANELYNNMIYYE